MTEADYYDRVRAMGLRPTQFQETFRTVNGEPRGVPLASSLTPEQRGAIIEMLERSLSNTA